MKSKWIHLKEKAIELRRQGNSLPYISAELGISKSTLSGWFKEVILTQEQKSILKDKWSKALVKARKGAVLYHNNLKKSRLLLAEKEARDTLVRIDEKNIDIADLALAMLYLGEGFKTDRTGMGNSDPLILRFFIRVLLDKYNLDMNEFTCELHLRADQNPEEMKKYWSKELNVPSLNFRAVSFDKRTIGRPTYPDYKGVCIVKCGNIAIQRKLIYLSRIYSTMIIEGALCKSN